MPSFPAFSLPAPAPVTPAGYGSRASVGSSTPWLDPWSMWVDVMTSQARSASAMLASPAPDNVIDFGAAFAAYRSAGGHAVAQVVHTPLPEPVRARSATSITSSADWPWPFPLGLFVWPSR
jgi:hypothetical protein